MNKQKFLDELTKQYEHLFANDEEYAYVKARKTPLELATLMTEGLDGGDANKDGNGIKNTCKVLGIKYTYKAIAEYLGKKE